MTLRIIRGPSLKGVKPIGNFNINQQAYIKKNYVEKEAAIAIGVVCFAFGMVAGIHSHTSEQDTENKTDLPAQKSSMPDQVNQADALNTADFISERARMQASTTPMYEDENVPYNKIFGL